MSEKLSPNSIGIEKKESFRKLDEGEIGKIKEAIKRFETTQDIYRKVAFDSAEKMLEKCLKMKDIRVFQGKYRKACPQF